MPDSGILEKDGANPGEEGRRDEIKAARHLSRDEVLGLV
jgi:hypothetical protein